MKRCFSFRNKGRGKEDNDIIMRERIKSRLKNKYYIEIEGDSLKKVYRLFKYNEAQVCENGKENYYHGIYFYLDKKPLLMEKYMRLAMEMGEEEAYLFLGSFYKSFANDKMVEVYIKGIKNGHFICGYKLGRYCEKEKKYDKMKRLYMLSIKKNITKAKYRLGRYYEEVERNYMRMEKYYLMAVVDNHTESMYRLGLYYSKKNQKELMELYLGRAIEKDHIGSIIFLANYYKEKGDNDKMINILLRGEKKNNKECIYILGKYYKDQGHDEKMYIYLERACSLGSTDAMNELALYYRLEENEKKMKSYAEQSIARGDIRGNQILADYYKDMYKKELKKMVKGISVENRKEIIEYLFKENEINILHDIYTKYLALGNNRIENTMKNIEDKEIIVDYYTYVAQNLDPKGYYYLGKYYETKGRYNKMYKYYTKAIERGVKEARRSLSYYKGIYNKK